MRGETENPVGNIVGQIHEFKNRLDTDPEFSRRTMLKGLGALIGLTATQGLVALDVLVERQERLLAVDNGDICADLNAVCVARAENLDVGLEQRTTSTTLTTTSAVETTQPPSTMPPTTTTASPPPQTLPPTSPEVIEPPDAIPRSMSYETYAANAELFVSRLPSLEQTHAMFPNTPLFNHVPEQLAHIDMLDKNVSLGSDEFRSFAIDQSYNEAFGKRAGIKPRLFIWHWAVGEYNDPQHLADKMAAGQSSVQLYVDKNNSVYQMVPDLFSLTGHAREPLNHMAVGLEVYTGEWGTDRSCLFGYTPERVKSGIYAAVYALASARLPINETTLLGHYAADLIFRNPYYDPATGTFHEISGVKPISIRKADPPQEFMKLIVAKAKALAQELNLRT